MTGGGNAYSPATRARMSAAQEARSGWTPAKVAQLRELASLGNTGREIGAALGFPTNAVFGKCWRLGIRLNNRVPAPIGRQYP